MARNHAPYESYKLYPTSCNLHKYCLVKSLCQSQLVGYNLYLPGTWFLTFIPHMLFYHLFSSVEYRIHILHPIFHRKCNICGINYITSWYVQGIRNSIYNLELIYYINCYRKALLLCVKCYRGGRNIGAMF